MPTVLGTTSTTQRQSGSLQQMPGKRILCWCYPLTEYAARCCRQTGVPTTSRFEAAWQPARRFHKPLAAHALMLHHPSPPASLEPVCCAAAASPSPLLHQHLACGRRLSAAIMLLLGWLLLLPGATQRQAAAAAAAADLQVLLQPAPLKRALSS